MAVDGADEVPQVKRLGEYEVWVNDKAVAFWPLDPQADHGAEIAALVCATGAVQSINTTVLPTFGVFDIIVRATDDAVIEDIDAPDLPVTVAGKATIKKMPLVRGEDGAAHIRFAVDHASVDEKKVWNGVLKLSGKYESGSSTRSRTAELQLQSAREETISNLFVFFVVHGHAAKKYAWVKGKIVDRDGTARQGVLADLKVLRDNLAGSGFAGINRKTTLSTSAAGELIERAGRSVIGLPSDWPFILSIESPEHVNRAHMFRATADDAKAHNGSPRDIGPVRLTACRNASLADRRIVLDPGHGVLYAAANYRRCQEWFVAARLADRIAEILHSEHGVAADHISFTKTAGLGLIAPAEVHVRNAPDQGEHRYQLDLPNRAIALNQMALGLHTLSALLLTRHDGEEDEAQEITEDQRNDFLERNRTTLEQIVTRLDRTLARARERVRPESPRWNPELGRYVYAVQRRRSDGVWEAARDNVPLPVLTTDWFTLDDDALWVLADRTARWSLACEVGAGPAASGSRPAFTEAARAAMRGAGARDYMRDKILAFLRVTAPHPYLSHGAKGWGPNTRLTYFNQQTDADLILTLHENAGGGKGGMILVSHLAGQDAPVEDQVRIGKVFLKYIDGFDVGLRQGGLTRDLAENPAAMLYSGHHLRDRYAYFESEFMDAIAPSDSSKYRYEEMVEAPFINRLARQIVSGIVEWLLDRQEGLDAVRYHASNQILDLW